MGEGGCGGGAGGGSGGASGGSGDGAPTRRQGRGVRRARATPGPCASATSASGGVGRAEGARRRLPRPPPTPPLPLAAPLQTDGSEPNKLLIAELAVARPRVAAADAVSAAADSKPGGGAVAKKPRAVLHPGEVNKIREVPTRPEIVVTHSDAADTFVWHTARQPDRAGDRGPGTAPSTPDLVLTGHADVAEFALACADGGNCAVASGGRDAAVLVWAIADADGALPAAGAAPGKLQPSHRFAGHAAPVEDVAFQPGNEGRTLASVGDDGALLLWDTRAGPRPAHAVRHAHGAASPDVQCVDWEGGDGGRVATGADDGGVRVWDVRKLADAGGAPAPTHTLTLSSDAVLRVEWSPTARGVFASGGDGGVVAMWDVSPGATRGPPPDGGAAAGGGGGAGRDAAGAPPPRAAAARAAGGAAPPPGSAAPPPRELFFLHAGHRSAVADFHWHRTEPFTLLSVSDDTERTGGGGTVQAWRVSELVSLPEDDAVALLRPHEEYILKGKVAAGDKSGGGGDGADGRDTPAPEGGGAATASGAPPSATTSGGGGEGGSEGGGGGGGAGDAMVE